MTIKKFTIPRHLWGRCSLLNEDGTMCYLDHLAKACDVPDEALRDRTFPDQVYHGAMRKYPRKFVEDTFGVMTMAAELNDDEIPAKEKEQRLKTLFKAHGIRLTFTGKTK